MPDTLFVTGRVSSIASVAHTPVEYPKLFDSSNDPPIQTAIFTVQSAFQTRSLFFDLLLAKCTAVLRKCTS